MRQTISEKKDSFSELYGQSFDYVYSYIFTRTAGSRALTEEIVQETFASAWQALDRFKGKSSFSTWVCSIAKNKLWEHYRREIYREKHEHSGDGAFVYVKGGANIEKAVMEKETRRAVLETLNRLPAFYSYALIMKYIDGLSVKEIAKITGRTPKAVDGVLQRARAAFEKAYLSMEGSDEKHER